MDNQRMIAYCGLICTECPAYMATKEDDVTKAQKTAEEWSKAFNVHIKIDDVWCDGCLVKGKKCAHCSECEIRACGIKRKVENCARCVEYPCEKNEAFFRMVPMARTTLDSIRNV